MCKADISDLSTIKHVEGSWVISLHVIFTLAEEDLRTSALLFDIKCYPQIRKQTKSDHTSAVILQQSPLFSSACSSYSRLRFQS